MEFLSGLESSSFVEWMQTSSWAYGATLAAHSVGISLTVGVFFVLDLRLLGLYRTIPLTSLERWLGLAWAGIVLNTITGVMIFPTQATNYVTNVPFILKLLFVALGVVTLVVMKRVLRRDAAGWEAAGRVPPLGRNLALGSALFWTMAVVTGRLIAYL